MGTSSMDRGQVKQRPLLPGGYDDDQQEDDQQENDQPENEQPEQNEQVDGQGDNEPVYPDVTWKEVKTFFTKYITSRPADSGSRQGAMKALSRKYVRASGGTRALVAGAKSGIMSGNGLINFFNSVITTGLEKTLADLQIEYRGKKANELLSLLVDAISPNSDTKEDIVARMATQDALANVYEYIERNNMDPDCLNRMSQDIVDVSMCAYLTSYIEGTMLRDLWNRLEVYEKHPDKAEEIENDLKGYIKGIVEVEFEKDKSIFRTNPGKSVKILMTKCLKAIEGLL